MTILGWLGNALICYCWWNPSRSANILAGAAGGLAWTAVGAWNGMWDLVFIEVLLVILQLRVWLEIEESIKKGSE